MDLTSCDLKMLKYLLLFFYAELLAEELRENLTSHFLVHSIFYVINVPCAITQLHISIRYMIILFTKFDHIA